MRRTCDRCVSLDDGSIRERAFVNVTFVKKILANGEPCAKCRDVEARLTDGNFWSAIDETLLADERDPESPGMRLAARLGVTRAPFFVVERPDRVDVYTVYFKFLREILQAKSKSADEAVELLNDNSDLDFI
jgi:hypothetical protein